MSVLKILDLYRDPHQHKCVIPVSYPCWVPQWPAKLGSSSHRGRDGHRTKFPAKFGRSAGVQ